MKSAIALSMHKAGSSVTDNILTEVFRAKSYAIDRIALQVPQSPLAEPDFFHAYQGKMHENSVYYGMARDPGAHDMPILDKLRLIFQLRDPRDCIVSAYFSFRQSHVPPSDPAKRAEWEARREELREVEIDQFACDWAPIYRDRMQLMAELIGRHDDTLVLQYEQMVEQSETWLERITTFVGQEITPELATALAPHLAFEVEDEKPHEHKRQVTPGDHRRKLAPQTIATMSDILAPVLKRFGYWD